MAPRSLSGESKLAKNAISRLELSKGADEILRNTPSVSSCLLLNNGNKIPTDTVYRN